VQALRYERDAIAQGEWWRLLSGHLAHLGWRHWALNSTALLLLAVVFGARHGLRGWLLLAVLSSLGVAAGLYLTAPQVHWYVGLSGTAHGLAAAGAVATCLSSRHLGLAWLCALAGKLLWEQWRGALPGSEAVIGGATIIDAHLHGGLAGLLLGLIGLAWTRPSARQGHRREDPSAARGPAP